MRILHVISSIDPRDGGPATALSGLAKSQHAAGLDVAVLATYRQGAGTDIADDLTAGGIHIARVGPAHGPLHRHRLLASALRAEAAGADIVHTHGVWEEAQHQGAVAARQLAKPCVMTLHGMLTPWSLRQKWLKKKIYYELRLKRDLNRAATIHVTSSAERDLIAPLKLKPPVLVEPLGVDLREFEQLPPAGAFRQKFPLLAGRKIVLFLGRLHPGKGMEYLIPAMAQLKDEDAVLAAVGPDSEGFRATLEKLARQHDVSDRVLFTGMLRGADRVAALADADLFVLPSEHENFGIVVVEALAAGTPVVVSDGVALSSDVLEGRVGASVPVGDVRALAAELKKWLSDDELRRAASDRARAFVRERYDWSGSASRWTEHYAALTAGRGSAR